MTTIPPGATSRNRLLASLPPDMLEQLLPRLVPVVLPHRQGLYAAGGPIDAVYFPESGMISQVAVLSEGMQAEVGVTGRDGMLGLPLLAGVQTSFVEAMVQMPGKALRMEAAAFRSEIAGNAILTTVLRRHGEAFQCQIMQTAACNGRHGLEQRLARWLLLAHDRTEGDELVLTQDFIATMLAVHRPSITVTASLLQSAGLIRYRAGRITILDRAGLEAAACECHDVVVRRTAAIEGISLP